MKLKSNKKQIVLLNSHEHVDGNNLLNNINTLVTKFNIQYKNYLRQKSSNKLSIVMAILQALINCYRKDKNTVNINIKEINLLFEDIQKEILHRMKKEKDSYYLLSDFSDLLDSYLMYLFMIDHEELKVKKTEWITSILKLYKKSKHTSKCKFFIVLSLINVGFEALNMDCKEIAIECKNRIDQTYLKTRDQQTNQIAMGIMLQGEILYYDFLYQEGYAEFLKVNQVIESNKTVFMNDKFLLEFNIWNLFSLIKSLKRIDEEAHQLDTIELLNRELVLIDRMLTQQSLNDFEKMKYLKYKNYSLENIFNYFIKNGLEQEGEYYYDQSMETYDSIQIINEKIYHNIYPDQDEQFEFMENAAITFYENKYYEKANQVFIDAIKLGIKLFQSAPSFFCQEIDKLFNNYRQFLNDRFTNNNDQFKDYLNGEIISYLNHLDFKKQCFVNHPTITQSILEIYSYLAYFNKTTNQEKSEGYYNKSIDTYLDIYIQTMI